MWIAILLLVLVLAAILLLNYRKNLKVKEVVMPTGTKPVSGRYRIWVKGDDEEGNPGRYYLVAYGISEKQASAAETPVNATKPTEAALVTLGGIMLYYFRPDGDVGELTVMNAPLYLTPIAGIVNTTFTDYFDIQVLRDKILVSPAGDEFANAAVSVCNDATTCVGNSLRFTNVVGGTLFNYESQTDGYRLYQDGEPRSYLIVGPSLCPAEKVPAGGNSAVQDYYAFTQKSCTSLPATKPGGPHPALVSTVSSSVLHFAK